MCSFDAMMLYKRLTLIFLFFLIAFTGTAQTANQIEVKNANSLEYDQRSTGKVKKMIGNVILKQDKTMLYCDSAYLFEEQNYVDAYGNVHINHQDSTNFYGDVLHYDGNKKTARLEKRVRMTDKSITLTTEELLFDMVKNVGSYTSGGKIVTTDNGTLTSRSGYYYTDRKEFFFKKDVVLNTPDYKLTCDTMKYNTAKKTAYFLGKTDIVSEDEKITANNGWYQTDKQIAFLFDKARVENKENTLEADTIYYERITKYGRGQSQVMIDDSANHTTVYGDYAEMFGGKRNSYITKDPLARNIFDKDTLYLLADTIFIYQKTAEQKDLVKAYRKVKMYKSDMQAICDSLVYRKEDSVIVMYKTPIMWNGDNQITADTIVFYINNRKIDSFDLNNNAFLTSKEAGKHFNQLKGKNMKGYFENNKIRKMRTYGNGQSIYYAKDDSLYVGVNVINCSEMEFYFANNKMDKGKFITSPDADFIPVDEVKPEGMRLKGFSWQVKKKPGKNVINNYFKRRHEHANKVL